MSVLAEPVRRLVLASFGLGDLADRVARTLTAAIDRREHRAHTERVAHGHTLPLVSRVRIATFIALATGVLYLPIEARAVRTDLLWSLLVLYGFHAMLTSGILIASFTATGSRHADALGLLLVVGHAASLHLYLYLWPTYPALASGVLCCFLVGSAVLFSWSTARTFVLAVLVCIAFPLVGLAAIPGEIQRPTFVVAWIVLIVGGTTAVGCARLLALLRANLARGQRELSALSLRLMSAQEEERRRLSRDLHDEFGQSLTAVNAYLWLIDRTPPSDVETLRSRTAEARHVISKTMTGMRELSHLLRPSVLDDFGLVPSLESLLKTFAKRHDVATTLTADGLPERLPAETETALYRITQEALTNAARYAQASHIRVALSVMGRELRLEIEDDGIGFQRPSGNAGPGAGGTGLIGIRERARALGGRTKISTRKGVCLRVHVPLVRAE
jgi:signal transduction histidine kinase